MWSDGGCSCSGCIRDHLDILLPVCYTQVGFVKFEIKIIFSSPNLHHCVVFSLALPLLQLVNRQHIPIVELLHVVDTELVHIARL